MTDSEKLVEKYYHSMGSQLVDAGNIGEAVIFFQRAIDIGDTPYAWYGMARVLGIAEDTAGAIGAISRAIKLAPNVPEYYYERAQFLKTLGRDDLAGEDMKKAIGIDSNYERIEEINRAAGILDEVFTDAFSKPSCPVVACPAYCCHFKDRLFLHGVTIGAWKLQALRKHFKEEGLAEVDFLDVFRVAAVENADSLFSPHDIIKHDGVASVTFPRRKDEPLGAGLARDIPKSRHYRSLMWIDDTAKPCCFFEGGRCSIYEAGGEPSLDSCSSFLCMTGFVFTVLRQLGMLEEKWVRDFSIGDLNRIAVEILIILARDVYGNEEMPASDEPDDGLKEELLRRAHKKIVQLFDRWPA